LSRNASPIVRFLILVAVACPLYLAGLGTEGIHRAQEARIAEVAREMRVSGNWLVPKLNAQVRLRKPPLPYWAVLGSYGLFGRVNEFAARFPTALCAIAGILLTGAFGARLFGARAGVFSGMILATTPLFIHQGRLAEADVPITLFVIAALFAFDRGFREDRGVWQAAFFAAMGVAFMTKGVPGLVIPLVAALGWLLWEGRGREALRPPFLGGLLLTVLIVLPWYAMMWHQYPEATAAFRDETLGRLGEDAPHAQPFYYYFYRLPLHFLPWIVSLPLAWWDLRRDPATRRAARLPLTWAVGGLVFLTLLQGKQPHYLVPILPPLAILCGGGIDRAIAAGRLRWLTPRVPVGAAIFMAVGALIYTLLWEPREVAPYSPREACRQAAARVGAAPLIFYQYNDSICVFYLRRTADVAGDESHLIQLLRGRPEAYVLASLSKRSVPPLDGYQEVWRSHGYKHPVVLLRAEGPV
jgi:4-amino-4-deoxy-L-arabinose transferase-like glycosyltransferase